MPTPKLDRLRKLTECEEKSPLDVSVQTQNTVSKLKHKNESLSQPPILSNVPKYVKSLQPALSTALNMGNDPEQRDKRLLKNPTISETLPRLTEDPAALRESESLDAVESEGSDLSHAVEMTDKEKIKARKAAKVQRAHQRILTQLDHAQRYLGLRLRKTNIPPPDPQQNWATQKAQEQADLKAHGHLLEPLNVHNPTPYLFEKDVLFISVDVEAWEKNHRLITEIGISTLDTRDLAALPPGTGAETWIDKIHSRHLRLRDHAHLQNVKYCLGDPNDFRFGKSEWVDLEKAGSVVDAFFVPPHQNPPITPPTPAPTDEHNLTIAATPPPRNIVLVGHNILADVSFLRNIHSHVFDQVALVKSLPLPRYLDLTLAGLPSSPSPPPSTTTLADTCSTATAAPVLLEILDTALLSRPIFPQPNNNTASLAALLATLGRDGFGLHNAGNDARYTMECLLALCVQARLHDDEKTQQHLSELGQTGGWV